MTVQRYCSVCHYCGVNITNPQDVTADHLIPKCALLLFPELRDGKHNKVKACRSCNGKKAQIPLSVFLEVRGDPTKLKNAQRKWQGIIFALSYTGIPNPDLREVALKAYQALPAKAGIPVIIPKAPISPPKVGPANPPFSKNKPLKRLYYLEDLTREWDEDRHSR